MLNTYLDTLVGETEKEKTAQSHLESQSAQDLAKAAGIEVAEDVCSRCMNRMEKRAHVYRCSCGMMKKALTQPSRGC